MKDLPVCAIATGSLEELIAGLSLCDAVLCADGGANARRCRPRQADRLPVRQFGAGTLAPVAGAARRATEAQPYGARHLDGRGARRFFPTDARHGSIMNAAIDRIEILVINLPQAADGAH